MATIRTYRKAYMARPGRDTTTKLAYLGDFNCSESETAYNGDVRIPLATSTWASIIREVFWRPAVGLIAGLSTLSTFASLLKSIILGGLKVNWKFVEWVLSWHWQTWVALWSLVWIIVILQGVVKAVQRRAVKVAKQDRDRIGLEEKLREVKAASVGEHDELERARQTLNRQAAEIEALKGEIARRATKFSFWLQLDSDKTATTIILPFSDRSPGSSVHVDIPCVNVVIWNEGESPFRTLGFRLEKEGQPTVRVDQPIGVPAGRQVSLDATKALLRVLSGGSLDLSRIQGTHAGMATLEYEQDNQSRESPPSAAYVRVNLSGTGIFNFQVGRKPFSS